MATAPTPFAFTPSNRLRKLSFLQMSLDLIVSFSNARIAEVLEKCCGHFKALLASSSRNASSVCRHVSDRIQFSQPNRRMDIMHDSMMDLDDGGSSHLERQPYSHSLRKPVELS